MPRISYTFLSAYMHCHLRAFLQYVQKVIKPEQVNHRNFIVGIVVDWLFTKWVSQGYSEGWMENKAEEMFNWFANRRRIIYRGGGDKQKLIYKTIGSVRRLEEAAFNLDLPSKFFKTQEKVFLKTKGIEFFGKLDMWFPEEGEVWDLKVTKQQKYLDNFQLYLYAWLMEVMGKSVNGLAFLCPLFKNPFQKVEWDKEIREEFLLKLKGLLSSISKEDWRRTAVSCWGCPVQAFCEIEDKGYKNKDGHFIVEL